MSTSAFVLQLSRPQENEGHLSEPVLAVGAAGAALIDAAIPGQTA